MPLPEDFWDEPPSPPEFEGWLDYADLALQFPQRSLVPVPVRLVSGERQTSEFIAKLDTGAEACFFGPEWARQLDIELGSEPSARGETVAGDFVYYTRPVTLVLPHWRVEDREVAYRVDVHFAPWNDPDDQDKAVLGVRGFLDRFAIGLQESVQRLWWGRDWQMWPRRQESG